MNCEDLYEKCDINGESVYFTDQECKMLYTGHVEYYFNGILCWEADIVNGIMEGLEKVYNNETGELESVNEKKYNMSNGLSIEYYKNGKIKSISTNINNCLIDFYDYDENGNISATSFLDEKDIHYCLVKNKIPELREKYNLEKLNKEILKHGKSIEYGKLLYK